MKKKIIRLTENDLHKIIKNSVKKFLNENNIGRNEYIDNLYQDVKRQLGPDKLCDELAGKIDDRNLKNILELIKDTMLPHNYEEEDAEEERINADKARRDDIYFSGED